MKVFIDTNILLDIYHLSGADLEELRKLKRMVEKGKVELLVSSQVIAEFWRNRERVVADALRTFRESKAMAKIPNIIRAYPEAKELKTSVDRTNEIVKLLLEKATEDIKSDALKADAVVRELLSAVTVGEITDEIFARAKRRCEVGNPPGKNDSLGDGINWEWLLEQEIEFWDEELVIISADTDYESELTKGNPREYLLREWDEKNHGCKLVLEKSLTDFLAARFPGIQLAEEIDKIEVIEKLENSSNFATTHKALAALRKYDDFKDAEIKRIVAAYLENGQVSLILGDDDVKSFGRKIIALAKSLDTREACAPLRERLDELDEADIEPPF